MDYHDRLIQMIVDGTIKNKDDLQRKKIELCRQLGMNGVPPNSETLARVEDDLLPLVEGILRRKSVRTLSGVAVVAVMTSPYACPHGRCTYCPGGVENNSPQSYTGKEPAARRGATYNFNPCLQVEGRIGQLESIGHRTDKIDLIVMGGTFTSRPREYQEEFIKGCFDGMNGCISATLKEAQTRNETADHRCIGMTLETRPDVFDAEQAAFSMDLGATRVELGTQILDDEILKKVQRGHGVNEVATATKLARSTGLKICYHLMPGLPGSGPQRDIESFKKVFEDQRFRPDMLKFYPTLVVKGTPLYEMWLKGDYKPYSTEEAVEVISKMKRLVPSWVRIQRIQRDIPVPLIEDGVRKGHLRELIGEDMERKGYQCQCIRCREVGLKGIESYSREETELRLDSYRASEGMEHFISFEIPEKNALVGYARLRLNDGDSHSNLRELKVFGRMVPLKGQEKAWQHRGFGKELVARCEEISLDAGRQAIKVTSGVGARRYYHSLGYAKNGPYMEKGLR